MKRMHEKSAAKKLFECEGCKKKFDQEANLKNHENVCGGGEEINGRKECSICQKTFAKSYFARHMRACRGRQAEQGGDNLMEVVEAQPRARVYRAKRKNCPGCGVEMAATNIARHRREVCQGGGVYS